MRLQSIFINRLVHTLIRKLQIQRISFENQSLACQMILNNSYSVKLSKRITKILYLYAAYNETFVFLAMISQKRDGVVHVNKSGEILFQHQFKIPMDTMGMLDERQAIFVETRKNRIAVLNLETHEFSYFAHQFMNEESDQTDIYTFSQTKYLCIEQRGRYNDNRYKLTYFPYPLKIVDVKDRKVTKNIACFEAKETEWTYQHLTKKANNYSAMCWFKPRHDDSFQFKTYQIIEGKGGVYKVYRFKTPISVEPHITKMETVIFNAWQLHEKSYIFVCLTNKTESKKDGGTVINSNYVVNLEKGQIRQTKFTFGPYQDYLIDYYNLGLHSMFRTYKWQDGRIISSPTYYVDNKNETIIAEESWECSHLFKYEFPGYSSDIICEGQYQCQDHESFKITTKRIFKPKDLYLHLICNCNAGIELDLIEDVLCVLGIQIS